MPRPSGDERLATIVFTTGAEGYYKSLKIRRAVRHRGRGRRGEAAEWPQRTRRRRGKIRTLKNVHSVPLRAGRVRHPASALEGRVDRFRKRSRREMPVRQVGLENLRTAQVHHRGQ